MSVTIFTSAAEVLVGRTPNGSSAIKVFFANLPRSTLKRYEASQPFNLETDGAILESVGPGGVVLEIIDFDELKSLFPNTTGSHLCQLTGVGTHNEQCKNQNCPGRCTMHSWPKYCSCEGA
jgi:hypothetical protein